MGEYLEQHRNEFFKKYSTEELIKDINSYQKGNGKLRKVLSHFFEENIYDCIGSKGRITPMEVLENDDIVKELLDYIKTKPNFYTSDNEVANLKSCLRNSSKYTRKVANFDPKIARDIYFKYYDINGEKINCLDTSMGFGSRMSAVLLSGHNYCGFDPNKKLFNNIKLYKQFLKENHIISEDQRCGLYCKGSEIKIDSLINTFDVSFTSPPYFNLEIYSHDNYSSSINMKNYKAWLKDFVYPTVYNTYDYLKINGYAMINIKNLTLKGKEPLFDDWFKAFESIKGFKFIETFDMEYGQKNYDMSIVSGKINNKEPIMVFKKIS